MMKNPNFRFLVVIAVWLLIGYLPPQVCSETFNMRYNPDIFDDQYIGCSDKLEDIMPKVLRKEKENKQFKDAWNNGVKQWEITKEYLILPEDFKDEYGIAILTFTNKYPEGNPIRQQLNGNLTMAGASRKDYMEKFHFKALHFYLTRALQILKPNCGESYTTYRGSPHSYNVKPLFKFGRFTSSYVDPLEVQNFGTESLFKITTCFGVQIEDFSFFPSEAEILIPPTEKFILVTKANSWFVLKSTGEMCSYFNCAFLQGEKREVALCQSDMNELKEVPEVEEQTAKAITPTEMEERINVLEDQINHDLNYRDYFQEKIDEVLTYVSNNQDHSNLLHAKLSARITAINSMTSSWLERENTHVMLMSNNQNQLESLKKDMKKQRERENATLASIAEHRELLASLQEECRVLRGYLVTLSIIFGAVGLAMIRKYSVQIRHQIQNLWFPKRKQS